MTSKNDLPKMDPDIYAKITLNELVVFSIYFLHNKNAEVAPEDIISACFMLFPRRFSLKNHPHWPDSAMVGRHWGICRNKGYIVAHDPGFRLTAKGSRLAEKVTKRLGVVIHKRVAKVQLSRPKAGTLHPAGKARSAGREEKKAKPGKIKKVQHSQLRASLQKSGPLRGEKAALSVSAKKSRVPRTKARIGKQVKKTHPVQKEKPAPPAPIKKVPVHANKPVSAKKKKTVIIRKNGKATLGRKVRSTQEKAHIGKRLKKVQPVQREKATTLMSTKKPHFASSKEVTSSNTKKNMIMGRKEKAVLKSTHGGKKPFLQAVGHKEEVTLPVSVKKTHPVHSEDLMSPKKKKIARARHKEKTAPEKKMQSIQVRARVMGGAQKEQVVQKEKAIPSVSIKKTPSVKKKKRGAERGEKAVLRPSARKPSPPRSMARPAAKSKTRRPVSKKSTSARPVPARPSRSDIPAAQTVKSGAGAARLSKFVKNARPIWTDKTRPPEPEVHPAIKEKERRQLTEKAFSTIQGAVTQEAKVRAKKFVRAMETSDAFRHYKKNGKSSRISEFDFRSLLLCTMESPPETLNRNMQKFKDYARIHNRQDLVAFLNFCEDKLSHLLTPPATRPVKRIRKQ